MPGGRPLGSTTTFKRDRSAARVTEEQAAELRSLRTACLLQASDGDAISAYIRLKGTAGEIRRKADDGEPGYTAELADLYWAAAEQLRERFAHQIDREQVPR